MAENNIYRLTILGVPIDRLTRQDLRPLLATWLSLGHPSGPAQIVTVNPEFIVSAQNHAEFAQVLSRAQLSLADGVGLVWASVFLYGPRKRLVRTTGVALTWELLKLAQIMEKNVYLLGLRSDEASERVRENLRRALPELKIVGCESAMSNTLDTKPIFRELTDTEANQALLNRIMQAEPDILLVAYGSPAQDLWLAKNLPQLPSVKIAVGVGGTFDYIGGIVSYAPSWIRALGLEWLYRLITQPRRWKRIFNATFVFSYLTLKHTFFPRKN